MSTYIAIDLKSYYASVECVARGLDPLKTHLLVADESRSDKTIVLAVSPALKALGLPGRPRLFEAKRLIRAAEHKLGHGIEYIVAPPRMAEYMRISAEIFGIYLRYAAQEDIQIYSIDECFIDATPYLHFYKDEGADPAHIMALKMIREVLAATGITATAGIGTNLYLAKIAMDIVAKHSAADADGVRIASLTEEEYRHKLWGHLPITDFWQVSGGTMRRLARYGMFTMGDIARMSLQDEELLYKIFGVNAEILIDHAWGIEPCTLADVKAYKPESNSLSIGQVLPRAYSFDETMLVLAEMADQLSYDMIKKDIISDHFSFCISFDEKSLESGDYSGPVGTDYYGRLVPKHAVANIHLNNPTSASDIIVKSFKEALAEKMDHAIFARKISVTAHRIRKDDHVFQLDLFTDYDQIEKERSLQDSMLDIRRRFGNNAVLKGTSFLEGGTARERNNQIGGHKA